MINSNQFEESWKRVKKLTGWEKSKELADFLGISGSSVSGTKGRGNFPLEWAYKIAKEFKGSVEWLLDGTGPMRPFDKNVEDEQATLPTEAISSPEDAFDALGLADGIGLLAEIYKSNDNIYIRAINANLLAFSDAVKTKAKMAIMAERMQEQAERMQAQLAQMEEKLNALEREVVRLRQENGELKRELRARSDRDDPISATG